MIAQATKKVSTTSKHIQGQSNTAARLNGPCFEQCTEPWYVASVQSRHEKFVASQLSAKGIANYLPLIERQKKWSDRCILVKEPIFPGYIFVSIPYEDRKSVLETRGVIKLLAADVRKPWSISVEEIEAIHKALNSNLACAPYPYLSVGTEVVVTQGPLQGCRGILVEKNKKHQLILSFRLIGQFIGVEIDVVDVKPL